VEANQALTQFQSINRIRIERLKELAPKSQQDFFDLLALLFHINSEELPAYISDDKIPAGIIDYQPNNAVIDAAKLLNPLFNFKRRPLRHYPIQGVYLINDHGGVRYPDSPTFELWLVHSGASTQTESLQHKLTAVAHWAESLGIDLSTRLLTEASLSQNSLSADDLNRFYLNGLVLAGSVPLWWAISPEQEASDYTQTAKSLTQQRLLGHTSTLDFGPIPEADPQLLLEQASSCLLLAMEQGLESSLNVLYSQFLLTELPNITWLCQLFKSLVYQGDRDPLSVDINVLKLHALLDFPEVSNEHKFLAQQSLYLIFNERLSQQVSQARYPWRRKVIKHLEPQWQWPQHVAKTLDQRQESNYRHCRAEYEILKDLHLSIRESLSQFAKKHHIDHQQSHDKLMQKHQLQHDVAPDTIPRLPSALLPTTTEENVYLYRFNEGGDWLINDLPLNSATEHALFKAPSLLRVLAWAVHNRLLVQPNRLKVSDNTEQFSTNSVLKLTQQLLRSPLATRPSHSAEDDLATTAECQQLMLFINLEQGAPQDTLSQQGLVRSSLQNDPLNYALKKQNLINSVEGLIYSSWGQWHYFSHAGKTAVLDMLTTVLLWKPSKSPAELTLCWCPSDAHGKVIERRIETLYSDVIAHYKSSPDNGDYLISISESYYLLQWQPGSYDFTLAPRKHGVFDILGKKRVHFSSTRVDTSLDPFGLFKQLLRLQSPKQLTLFLTLEKKSTILYLLDEHGTLYTQTFNGLTESTLNGHFHHFLNSIKQKNDIERLRFYRLKKAKNKVWEISAMPLSSMTQKDYLPVTIELSSTDKAAQCTIHCGPQAFSGSADDQALFLQVNELVLSLRKSSSRYPLYITELSFPEALRYSSYDYITQKQRLETLLNNPKAG